MTVKPTDLTLHVPELGDVVFPDISLLFSFVFHARWMSLNVNGGVPRVVDVGGGVGGFTLAALLSAPNAQFDVIEPWSACYPYLCLNLSARDGVTLHRVAASDTHGTLTLSMGKGYNLMGHASVYGEGAAAEQVEAIPLDELIQGGVDLLKIDVEGHEMSVLHGAQRLITEWHPFVFIEIKRWHQERAGRKASDIGAFLLDRGYGAPTQYGSDYLFKWGEP